MSPRHLERHAAAGTTGWLRPFVLGAEDGLVSTAGLVIGVVAAGGSAPIVLAAGVAGLTSGALSMAVGEYVSVAAQRDVERADIALETWELANRPEAELEELVSIYRARGLSQEVAREVAVQLTEHDALGTHLREELSMDPSVVARPWQAAWISAVSFAIGAALPILSIVALPKSTRIAGTIVASVVVLAAAGAAAARLGGSRIRAGAIRVAVGGVAGMAITWGVGLLVNGTS